MAFTVDDYRPFGSLGDMVSPIGLGTVKIGRNQKVKNACGDGFTLPSDKQIEKLLDTCLELGINLIDTAPAYGCSEERLGQLMGNRRDKFFLMSKTGENFDNDTITSEYNFDYDHTVKSVESSLQRLKTSHLDCVLIHSNGDDVNVLNNTGVVEALSSLKNRGDIRSFGFSGKTVVGGKLAVDLTDAVMVTLNPTYSEENEVINYAHEKNKVVLIKKGLVSGNVDNNISVEDCLKCSLLTKGVASLVLGTVNPGHLRSNVQTAQQVLKSIKS